MVGSSEAKPIAIRILFRLLKLFFRRHILYGLEQIDQNEPAVFICNHSGAYSPIVMTLYFPFTCKVWIHASLVSPELCSAHNEINFCQKALRLRPRLSHWLAGLIAPVCIRLMRQIGAIPVYKGQMKIRDTLDQTLQALLNGNNILIFPEHPDMPHSAHLNEFCTGFAYLARSYYEASGRLLCFHPVYVDKTKKQILIGAANTLKPFRPFRHSKAMLAAQLRDAIDQLAAGS